LIKVRCICGHEILLVPDAKVMGEAIESHLLEHKKKNDLTEEEINVIIEDLIAQVFRLSAIL
jgi:hypothetical protein